MEKVLNEEVVLENSEVSERVRLERRLGLKR